MACKCVLDLLILCFSFIIFVSANSRCSWKEESKQKEEDMFFYLALYEAYYGPVVQVLIFLDGSACSLIMWWCLKIKDVMIILLNVDILAVEI